MESDKQVSAPDDGADLPKMEPGSWMAFREQGKVSISLGVLLRVPSWITLFSPVACSANLCVPDKQAGAF